MSSVCGGEGREGHVCVCVCVCVCLCARELAQCARMIAYLCVGGWVGDFVVCECVLARERESACAREREGDRERSGRKESMC